jgi:hypothetical protein
VVLGCTVPEMGEHTEWVVVAGRLTVAAPAPIALLGAAGPQDGPALEGGVGVVSGTGHRLPIGRGGEVVGEGGAGLEQVHQVGGLLGTSQPTRFQKCERLWVQYEQ